MLGKDTRISSDMLECALIAGICSVGGDVKPLGTIPTPAVAYLTVQEKADAGIVISASHNPYEHNGIKVFNSQGYKLPDETEARIEEKILSTAPMEARTRGESAVVITVCGSCDRTTLILWHPPLKAIWMASGFWWTAPTARLPLRRRSFSAASRHTPISSTGSRTASISTIAAAPRIWKT
jgi:hypothetical protein